MWDSILGAAVNYAGARQANKTNVQMAREAMQFGRESQDIQHNFQERMSNTSYQRAMQDMRSAGLNPILAFNQGGASSPSGSAPGGQAAHVGNEFAGAVSSAVDIRRSRAELANLEAQNHEIKSRARLNGMLAKVALEDAFSKAQHSAKAIPQLAEIDERTGLMKAQKWKTWFEMISGPFSALMRGR